MGEWTDKHDMLIRDADPADPALGQQSAAREHAWMRVEAAIASSPPPSRPRRAVLTVAAVAVLVVVSGAATAGVISSRTGNFDTDQEDRVLGGPGERLDPSAGDFPAVVSEETADIPFPSAEARAVSLDFQVSDLRRSGALVSTSALAGFVANDAICSWANEWARATQVGDATAVVHATASLDAASSWDAVVTLQNLESDRFAWLDGVQDAARGSAIPALGTALRKKVYCNPDLMPDLPEAIPNSQRERSGDGES